MEDKTLRTRHILIAEDDFYQAEESREYLTHAGGIIVACRGTTPDLDELLSSKRVDIALLDINLGHTQSFDFARALQAKAIPFLFLSGYDPKTLPPDLAHTPLIRKPAEASAVIDALLKRLQ